MEREKIVEALRCCGNTDTKRPDCEHCPANGYVCVKRMLEGAADMLENDQREAEALRAEIEKLRKHNDELTDGMAQYVKDCTEKIEQITAERDAAVADIEGQGRTLRAFSEATKGVPLSRARELAQADREGRVVVLEIPPKSRAWVCKKSCPVPHEAYFPTASAIITDMESGYVFGKTRDDVEQAIRGGGDD